MSNYTPKILITGGDGQLACALRNHLLAHEFQITACSRAEIDITKLSSVKKAIDHYSPDILINTAAYTGVDKAEHEIEQAMGVNHLGAQNLAIACEKYQIPLIHLSTDYIFDGTKTCSYLEDDKANPINIYGKSKWLGEQAVREQCEQHIILRVSGVFGEYGNNFLKTMLHLALKRKELCVVDDQITCQTYTGDIAGALYAIVKNPHHWGTYHYCSADSFSWHQFAMAIIEEAKKHRKFQVEKIQAITTAEYPAAVKRPAYSVLDCGRIKKDYEIRQPLLRTAIEKTLAGIYL